MSLNPVQFGTEVIDQFGRYLMTTFPIADRGMEEQVRRHLRHELGGERLIAKGPYVFIHSAFEEGPSVADLCADPKLGLHPVLKSVFPYESLHKHQELTLRAIKGGRHTVVATGTGSGKTEAFLLPVVDHALHLRDAGAAPGVAAVLVYPMNALVDDQLRRLRPLLAGTGVTFGRYTGVTPEEREPEQGRLRESRPYTARELGFLREGKEEKVPIPWEECFTRRDIRERKPRILLTNFHQLEYLLLRDLDLDLFRDAPLRFFVVDEVHTYTGALGSEVSCLIRRLRHVAGQKPEDVLCVGTSATVQQPESGIDAGAAVRNFAARLFGVERDRVELVTEQYDNRRGRRKNLYVPPRPSEPRKLLDEVLAASRELQLLAEVADLPETILRLVERLCGRTDAAGATTMEQAFDLLARNKVVLTLADLFRSPELLEKALPRLEAMDRKGVAHDELVAELLAYLTLGALVQEDDEPLLRPKLHYFVQGYQGLGCSLDAKGEPKLHFDAEAGHDAEGARVFPLVLCRSCGQHYFPLVTEEPVNQDGVGIQLTTAPASSPEPHDAGDGRSRVYATNRLVGLDETGEEAGAAADRWLCRICGTLHDAQSDECRNGKCRRPGTLVPVVLHQGEMKTCLACGTAAKGYEEIVTPARSSEVADVTILAQSMLTAMREESLRKLLVFSDNRQDAAFQAGWMEERSRRFRLRHLLYKVLDSDRERVWSLEKLTERIVDLAKQQKVLKVGAWDDEDSFTRVRWFLLEEFASTGQRRGSLETLALAEVRVRGIDVAEMDGFYGRWAPKLRVRPEELQRLVRLILDYYRRRGVVSDPLLRRRWNDRDLEVRKGLVAVSDQYRPQALVFSKSRDDGAGMLKAWTAKNGRSGAQEIFRKGVPGGAEMDPRLRDECLEDLWERLKANEVLVPVQFVYKHGGRVVPSRVQGALHQINVEKLGVVVTDRRLLCAACRRAQSVPLPTGACPEYNCKGVPEERGRDDEHFDVWQYTRTEFVPLKPREHSAQVPKETRQKIEREFKRESGGEFNCLVCTPTLELGVDIGKLEMVLMRNVPPTPANYAQRAGRAGRRHRIAVVFTHCRSDSHGRYFFQKPQAMIAGEIRVPVFSMRNEPLIRKHVHSAILTALRSRATSDADKRALDDAFPAYVSHWFADTWKEGDSERVRYRTQPRDLGGLERLVKEHRDALIATLEEVFLRGWPADEAEAVAPERLAGYVDEFVPDLRRHVHGLFAQVQTYRQALKELRDIEERGEALSDEQAALRRRYDHALRAWLDRSRQDNYALSYLGIDGFLPGYAMARETVRAQCLEPFVDISRPAAVALRELTPANHVYADRNIFRVRKLRFETLRSEDERTRAAVFQRMMVYDRENERVYEKGAEPTEGGKTLEPFVFPSMQMTDVEMQPQRDIDDREPMRRRVWFKLFGRLLPRHAGGRRGKIGPYDCRFLQRADLSLVNLGRPKGEDFTLFPVCASCGATRSPTASQAELDKFAEDHRKIHGRNTVGHYALHVEFTSDAVELGPFKTHGEAANVFESIRIGARHVLDMGTTEVEGFILTDQQSGHWIVFYDPMPGGSGYLPQILRFWEPICRRATDVLQNCATACDTACYSCLKHFYNQQDHDVLNRHEAINLLADLTQPLEMEHAVPAVTFQPMPDAKKTDSNAELDFGEICRKRGFPVPPAQQFRVSFEDGSYTDADWAYPDRKVLVFIDGMSAALHGDPRRRARDKLLRAKARLKGFQVVEITAEALQDEGSLAVHLEELAMYLGEG
ncbi:MAG: DEAD/DEAH box helicase [Myxococcales bacterium]|nr:DEAD/DEAH box helicase [Myxococcales bacterium]